MELEVRQLTAEEFADALALRMEVFVDEQKVPPEEEHDALDASATHFGAFEGTTIVGTGRLVVKAEKGKIGRMAVRKDYRGRGVGLAVLEAIVDACRELGLAQAFLSSQLHAIPFYEKMGFRAQGDIYLDAGIEHKDMILDLQPK